MRILYFAWLREKTGIGAEELTPPPQVRSVAELIAWLETRSPGHKAAFANRVLLRAALDLEFCTLDAPLGTASEIAFFPPVTGG